MFGGTVNESEQLSYWCSGTLTFLECSSMLNAAPVTNAFLSYTWLVFFSTSWLHYYFTGYLITYWWERTPCVIVVVTRKPSKKRGLKVLFAGTKNELSILSSISFLIYESQKSKILEEVLEFIQQVCHWNLLIELGYW